MTGRESRRVSRYKAALPVEVGCEKYTTLNVSSSGIFFETDKSFSPGQPIEFTIVLEYVDPDQPVRLKCLGAIVRVEDKGKSLGVAASISSYSFEKVENAAEGRRETDGTGKERRWDFGRSSGAPALRPPRPPLVRKK